jgi:hypothetical protein
MRLLIAAIAATSFGAFAQTPRPADFAWRAPVEAAPGASLLRVDLPASALARMQSPRADDVRVFNAAGEAVPFAWIGSTAQAPAAAEERTQPYRALPLYSLPGGTRKAQGSVQVNVGGAQPVWVRVDGAPSPTPDARPLDSVLFDTRALKKPLSALDFEATLPANTPVRIAVYTSRDLGQWTQVPVRGRLYRFEGEQAPQNLRLVFERTASLGDQYFRVDWAGQPGVVVNAIMGVIAGPGAAPRRVQWALPAPREVDTGAIEIATGFSTPMAGIALSTPRDNTLVPVRVLGRNDNSQPWVILGQTVVYRLGSGGEAMSNPPLDLNGASVRQIRIVTTSGTPIAPAQLHAAVEFRPRQLVFVTSGSAPFTVAAGRERTDAAALPAATLTGMLGARKVDDLPLAALGAAVESATPADEGWLPGIANRTAALWAVLLIGVAVLGGVAWSLMHQMRNGGHGNGTAAGRRGPTGAGDVP